MTHLPDQSADQFADQVNDQFEGIAVVGLAGRFPGAADADAFWRNLRNGVESVKAFTDAELLAAGEDPALLQSPAYVRAGAVLDDVGMFDADFFGFTPREAEVTEPQHRLFLECAWEALEHAGYDPGRYEGRIGVFAGAGLHCFYQHNLESQPQLTRVLGELARFIAIEKDFISTRVSYRLNLTGPSLTIQTACSTSLVSVHVACQSLLNGECDMALAGGVSIRLPQAGYLFQEGSILSPDGHCRAFDANAQGTIFGSGAGIVVLKRHADAVADGDTIHAVIRGSCINNDGALKVGYTAPSMDGQAKVIAEAQALAGVSGDDVSYIETHGTGTTLGDPIEVAALTKAFRRTTQQNGFCAIGSVKPNVGHLDAAAGVAGLIKVILSMQQRVLPPSLHYEKPNPAIDFAGSPFFVQQKVAEWNPKNGRRIAGISSFGIGGTNAHVVVEEAPAAANADKSRPWQLITLAARTPAALDRATERLNSFLSAHQDANLADVAFTLQQGRKHFTHRRAFAADSVAEAVRVLSSPDAKRVRTGKSFETDPSVVFMFPAQGSQHANMGRELYEHEPVFRENVDRCATQLLPILGVDIRTLLYPEPSREEEASAQLKQTGFTQPTVFTINYALAQLWLSWGMQPAAMLGHSLGEYVAATLAGVFELGDALKLVSERARLMQELPAGSMLAVPLREEQLQPLLPEHVELAALNAPGLCVVSGEIEAVERLAADLREKGIEVQPLLTSHAFHSAMMEPMLAPFREAVARVPRRAPRIPVVSTLTGTWMTAEQAVDPEYWVKQTRFGVRFSPAIQELIKTPGRVLLEVGPGTSLTTLAKMNTTPKMQCAVVNSMRHAKDKISDLECLTTALGSAWVAGVAFDAGRLYATERRRHVPLPTYPFERKRFWIESHRVPVRDVSVAAAEPVVPADSQEALRVIPRSVSDAAAETPHVLAQTALEKTLAALWREVLGVPTIGIHDNFFELGGHSLMGVTLVGEIGRALGRKLPLASLVNAPTIHEFAKLLDDQKAPATVTRVNTPAVKRQVRSFIVENYTTGGGANLKDSDSLVERGLLDELSVLDLTVFLEETFGLTVSDRDMSSENLGSIESISSYVQGKLN